MRCEICQRPTGSNSTWCRLCARSYDRWLLTRDNDGSTAAALTWTARRCWYFARQRIAAARNKSENDQAEAEADRARARLNDRLRATRLLDDSDY